MNSFKNVKAKSVLVFEYHVVETCKLEVKLHTFLTLIPDGVEWTVSPYSRIGPCMSWIGDWKGPRAGLDAMVKGKIPVFGSCPALSESRIRVIIVTC